MKEVIIKKNKGESMKEVIIKETNEKAIIDEELCTEAQSRRTYGKDGVREYILACPQCGEDVVACFPSNGKSYYGRHRKSNPACPLYKKNTNKTKAEVHKDKESTHQKKREKLKEIKKAIAELGGTDILISTKLRGSKTNENGGHRPNLQFLYGDKNYIIEVFTSYEWPYDMMKKLDFFKERNIMPLAWIFTKNNVNLKVAKKSNTINAVFYQKESTIKDLMESLC
jgi:hypothetical protein